MCTNEGTDYGFYEARKRDNLSVAETEVENVFSIVYRGPNRLYECCFACTMSHGGFKPEMFFFSIAICAEQIVLCSVKMWMRAVMYVEIIRYKILLNNYIHCCM